MDKSQQAQPLAAIKFLTGPLSGTTLDINQPITTIGRDKSNDLIVADRKVSRFHARLVWHDGSWKIEKLSQTSIITIDQQSIEQSSLSNNAIIELGEDTSFLFLLTTEGNQVEATEQKRPSTASLSDDGSVAIGPVLTAKQKDSEQLLDAAQKQPSPVIPQGPAVQPPGTEIASLTALGIPSIQIKDNTSRGTQSYPLAQSIINIGRAEVNDVVIPEQFVSDFHLQIVREDKQFILIHPHPAQPETVNGLLYQGRKIEGSESFRKPLERGDMFRIADEYGSLVTLTYNDGSGSRQEVAPSIQPIQLGAAEITLGRLQDNAVVLNHPQVSAHHARLLLEQGSYRIIDLNSTNHTYVNGLRTTSQMLQSRDEVRIGPFRFIYADTELIQYDESEGIRIDARDLKKVGNNQTILLNDISLSIPARSFVALVGGSGAGKTTLLDALSGLRPAQEGSVFYNGQDYYRHLAAFSSQLGYVPQDDIIHRELTVERALYYAAKLRLPRDFTEAQIEQRIEEVLIDVEMTHRRSLLINRLSGGQRKRVSIALELLAKPNVFFLDEPTSGLDPGLDRKMMLLLRKLVDKGHTVILVTHATHNINVCDYVCFLAAGGNLAYYGPPDEARDYFKQPDFAEIYSVLEPGDNHPRIPVEAGEKFRQSQGYQKYIGDLLNQRPETATSFPVEQTRQEKGNRKGRSWRQFLILSRRYLELLKNDWGNLAILLLQAPLIGLLLLVFIKAAGPGGLDPGNVVQCPATAAIVAAAGYPDVPTPNNPVVSTNCQRVENFLTTNPQGKAYAGVRGGVAKALQDFIRPGPGFGSTVLFLMAFSATLFGCVNAIREFVKEGTIYRRERAVNLGILPYMFSKIAVLGALCLLQSVVLVLCIGAFDPFGHSIVLPPFLEIYITIALTSLAGLMLGLMVSALAPTSDRATSLVPILLIPQVIFSGAVFPLTSWALQILAVFAPVRWSMAALGSSAGLHSETIAGDKLFGNNYTYHGTLFSTYSQSEALRYLLLMWMALVIMILVFGIATGFFLKRKDTLQKS